MIGTPFHRTLMWLTSTHLARPLCWSSVIYGVNSLNPPPACGSMSSHPSLTWMGPSAPAHFSTLLPSKHSQATASLSSGKRNEYYRGSFLSHSREGQEWQPSGLLSRRLVAHDLENESHEKGNFLRFLKINSRKLKLKQVYVFLTLCNIYNLSL